MHNQLAGGIVPSGHFSAMPGINSLEIARMVQKRHDNVRRTIATLIQNGIISSPQNEVIEEINNLQLPMWREVFVFSGEKGKRDSIIVVAQLSPEFTARLVDRWQELESAINKPVHIPQTLPEALRLAADLAEQKTELEGRLALAAPKVEFVDRYVNASGSMTFRQVAKLLDAKEPEFRLFLIESHIMYRLNGTLTPYHQHTEAGRFEIRTGTSNTSNHAFSQSRFTAKGVQWIGGLWTAYKAGRVDH
ncbi:phage antirepressor KilAC domain-containing protein [Pantoea dispersa]|uniref:phage antirepressor KilAC domain-containing protein n=1 Tax=Pantoea dispersa TaxID=59814 RepID=UPI0024AF15DA|nr:DNA-binding protein [Pantoea dispersa]MDI6637060.1 phage antirepressor KilAC domain-containing protein [Pantoea dispersa]